MNFCSDNVTGVSPSILAALTAENSGSVSSYGTDDTTQALTATFSEIFETSVQIFPVATGTAANALALATLTPPYGAIYCHAGSHIYADECGAPELYTGGAKLVPLSGLHGKLTAETISFTLARAGAGVVHHVQPAVISLTQATEAGTVYRASEIKQIGDIAQQHRLFLHMDGARFANALVTLGCTPAEITWKAGVDVLCFGATKNGAMAAEAVIFFNPELAQTFEYRRKRGGHLFSKMRFLSTQLAAYLKDDLWLKNATHANYLATQLANGLAALPGVELCHPVEANEVFVHLPEPMIVALYQQGFQFYRWEDQPDRHGDPHTRTIVRLVTAFNTDEAAVKALIQAAQQFVEQPVGSSN